MRVFIFGATGSVGAALERAVWPADTIFCAQGLIGTERVEGGERIDITNACVVDFVLRGAAPDIVVNAAGYTDVDGAERERDKAFAVNALGPRHIASACREIGAKLIHISTDMVFGGRLPGLDPGACEGCGCDPCVIENHETCPGRPYPNGWPETAKTNPVNYYGQTKLEGEHAVAQHLQEGQYCIVRTTWILGTRGWLPWAVNAATNGHVVEAPTRVCRPTIAADLAAAVVKIARAMEDGPHEVPPILHFTNRGEVGRHTLLHAIDHHITPGGRLTITWRGLKPHEARRAERSVLDCSLYESIFSEIPHWAGGLARAIEALR